jgi:hypothetical protein
MLALTLFATATFAPMTAQAQSKAAKHRQKTKNEWRNIAIGSGALAILGLVKHDNTLTFIGAAGALYSADRYEKDRKSQKRSEHARYTMFRKASFTRNGHRYVRKTVTKNGHKYYQFVRKS